MLLDKRVRPILAHAGFVLWLMAFPYEGLLVNSQDALPSLFFLLPHAASLLIFLFILDASWFPRLADSLVFIVLCVTLFFPYFQEWIHALLAVTGSAAAVLPLRLGLFHAASPRPVLSAAIGQSIGIGLICIIPPLPLPLHAKFILVALPLLLFRRKQTIILQPHRIKDAMSDALVKVLPVIFLFYTTSGLTHGLLLPLYTHAGHLPGLELFFYVLAILIGSRLAKFSVHLPLTLAIVLTMFALGLWQSPERIAVDLSMYAMHFSKGFADIFLLALMLGQRDVARSFALGIGIMLLGLSGGIYLALVLGHQAWAFVLVGNTLVCATVLVFFYQSAKKGTLKPATARATTRLQQHCADALRPNGGQGQSDDDRLISRPEHVEPMNESITPGENPSFMQNLSHQERNVLDLVLTGANYKQIAKTLCITESSVKTYMTRVCTKAGAKNKNDLLKKNFAK